MGQEIFNPNVDIIYILRLLIQMGYEKKYDGNEKYSKAMRFAYADVLVGDRDNALTDEEIMEIAEKYADDNNITELRITGEDHQKFALLDTAIQIIPRINDLFWEYSLKGYNADFSVIDLRAKKEHVCSNGSHYKTILEIIRKNYRDEFKALNQQEKDNFVLSNFKLIGQTMANDWYVPSSMF
ncbi:hypothetical protein ACE4Z8_03220 [Enterococcus avium]|uniref:hypothetical protein n=1 Tax=Enterococcus avium TaxID=33945 RepID=UPI0028923975|nr:hypothetical protein [Enterococcus avium]MDT2385486.1 hypothetical protein [Enterococcus avium]MDT2496649.1 hypothetical protein [Enterococcus avium]